MQKLPDIPKNQTYTRRIPNKLKNAKKYWNMLKNNKK